MGSSRKNRNKMKKILTIVFCVLLFPIFGYSQNVRIDKYSVEDSTRIVLSYWKNLYTEWSSAASFSVGYAITKNNLYLWQLELCLNETKLQIGIGRKLLLKFDDGTIIELENAKEIGPADYEYKVTKYGTNYYVYPSYNITEDQIQQIINGNVIKLRIEHEVGYLDRELKGIKKKSAKSRFSEGLKDLYENVKTASNQENNIRDNF